MDRVHLKIVVALMALITWAMVAVEILAVAPGNPPTIGNPAVAKLETNDDKFFCSAFYFRQGGDTPETGSALSWIASAGHCANTIAYPLVRGAQYSAGTVTWRALLLSRADLTQYGLDFALGTVPDVRLPQERKYYRLSEKDAEQGQSVIIHGFPHGKERILHALVGTQVGWGVKLKMLDGIIEAGHSGSPVLAPNGEVVGILWGVSVEDPREATMTPTSVVRLMLTTLQVRR